MKKSLLLFIVYFLALLQKADGQTRKLYYEPGMDIYCDWNMKPYQKNSRWNSTSTLLLSMKLSVSDRVIIFNNLLQRHEDKNLK